MKQQSPDHPIITVPAGKIFIIGFMGSGKTHWAKLWADTNGLDFLDLDDRIELLAHKSVEKIFEEDGEAYFRKLERQCLRELEAYPAGIIACGGGTPCHWDNMDWMNAHGTTVYLSATPGYVLERVMTEKDKRPLLKKVNPGELLFFIEQKLKEREVFYQQAKYILRAGELNSMSVAVLNDKSTGKN